VELLGPSTGGIRAHVGELSRRLGARGWTVVVAAPAGVMAGAGRQDVDVDVAWAPSPARLRRARAALRRACEGADVVHVHGVTAAALALTLRRRPPVVLTIHNVVAGTQRRWRARLLAVLERAIVARCDHVVVISPEIDRIAARAVGARRSSVLPVAPPRQVTRAPADVRAEHRVAPDAPLLVAVARLHPQKDLPTFLRACARVRDAAPGLRALVVGEGPARRELEALRTALHLDRVVTFTGWRPNPVDEMAAADVVVLSSRWEGSPLAVAECLALGRPLVSTAVGTVTHHLADGVSACIVPVGDDAAVADAVVGLLRDPDLAARIAAAGRRVAASTFDPERLVAGVEAAYAAAIADRRHGRRRGAR